LSEVFRGEKKRPNCTENSYDNLWKQATMTSIEKATLPSVLKGEKKIKPRKIEKKKRRHYAGGPRGEQI